MFYWIFSISSDGPGDADGDDDHHQDDDHDRDGKYDDDDHDDDDKSQHIPEVYKTSLSFIGYHPANSRRLSSIVGCMRSSCMYCHVV